MLPARVGSPRGPAGGPAPRNGVAPRRAPSPSSPRSAPWWPCSSWCVFALSPGIPHLLDDPHPPSRPEHRALASPRDTPTHPTASHPARLPRTLDPLPGHQGTPRDHLRTRRGAVPERRAHPRRSPRRHARHLRLARRSRRAPLAETPRSDGAPSSSPTGVTTRRLTFSQSPRRARRALGYPRNPGSSPRRWRGATSSPPSRAEVRAGTSTWTRPASFAPCRASRVSSPSSRGSPRSRSARLRAAPSSARFLFSAPSTAWSRRSRACGCRRDCATRRVWARSSARRADAETILPWFSRTCRGTC